jgi:thioredoxin-related protein
MKYRVTAYPSLLFIDHTGKVKKYALGYHTANQLVESGKKALK